VPRLRGRSLKPLAPLPSRGDSRIEDPSLTIHDAGLAKPGELVPRHGPDGAGLVTKVYAPTPNERGAESRLEPAQAAEEPVNRAPGSVRVSLIDRDRKKAVVPPLTRNGQGLTMRPPLLEIRVDLAEEDVDLRRHKRTVRGEDPDAGRGGKG